MGESRISRRMQRNSLKTAMMQRLAELHSHHMVLRGKEWA